VHLAWIYTLIHLHQRALFLFSGKLSSYRLHVTTRCKCDNIFEILFSHEHQIFSGKYAGPTVQTFFPITVSQQAFHSRIFSAGDLPPQLQMLASVYSAYDAEHDAKSLWCSTILFFKFVQTRCLEKNLSPTHRVYTFFLFFFFRKLLRESIIF